jgi:hypothetical protein
MHALFGVEAARAARALQPLLFRTSAGTLPETPPQLPTASAVAQALFDLEATNAELKGDLRDLYIAGAKEVDVSASRKAILINVPYRLLKAFHKIQQRLVRELEKKFSGERAAWQARHILPFPRHLAALSVLCSSYPTIPFFFPPSLVHQHLVGELEEGFSGECGG